MANRLALELLADANPLVRGMQQAQASINDFVDASEEAGQAIGGTLGSAIDKFINFSKGGAAAAGLLVGGLAAAAAGATALTLSVGRHVEALGALSQKTGISTHTLQGWSVILKENNTDAEVLARAMTGLSRKVSEAQDPLSNSAKVFKALGVDIANLGSTEDILKAIADKFHEMPDGIDKARFATELMSESGLQLIQALNRGGAAFDKSKEAAHKYAAILDPIQEKTAQLADDAFDRLSLAAESLKNQLGVVFAPTVLWATETFTDMVAFLARAVKEVDVALDTLAIRITHVGLAAREVASVLFSSKALSGSAWEQVGNNITLINKEAEKLIAKRRDIAQALEGAGSTANLKTALFPSLKEGKAAKEKVGAVDNTVRGLVQDEHVQALREYQAEQTSMGKNIVALSVATNKEIAKQVDLYFESERGLSVITEQEAAGYQIVLQTSNAWAHRNDELEIAVDRAKAADEAQQAMFRTEFASFGASDQARMVRMKLIEAEGALQKRVIEETIFNERKRAVALENLDIELNTKRRQAIQEYPSFFEQQMQAVVQSNSFSIGQISNTWTSGLANAAINGGNFVEQAWKSTQVAVLQGLLNFGIQKIAALTLQASMEMGLASATAASVVGINTAKNATVVAGDAAAATATTSIWAGAGATIIGTFATITGAITGFFTATLIPFFVSIGTAIMTFMSSIAAAASATVFGIPYAVAIMAGVAVIGAAIGTIAAFAFADGGVVTKPTLGMVGEAHSSEAVIPLNARGAAFMQQALGATGGSGQSTSIVVELDGRTIARSVFDQMPSIMRVRGVAA